MTEPDPNHRRLEDLGRAVASAMERSTDIASAIERLRREGFSLYLVLEPDRVEGSTRRRFEVSPRLGNAEPSRRDGDRPGAEAQPNRAPRRPEFRLDVEDVQLLRAMGIDATRPGRRRR